VTSQPSIVTERRERCCVCGATVCIDSITTPDPECPEMLLPQSGAWMALVSPRNEATNSATVIFACSRACVDVLMAEGWCG
jgi:hypothetical protein